MKRKALSIMLMSLLIISESLVSPSSATVRLSEVKPVEVSNPLPSSNQGGDRESKEKVKPQAPVKQEEVKPEQTPAKKEEVKP